MHSAFSRLIVRMHRFVKQPDLCWSRGALFEHGETQVLVETTTRGNEIALRSRGPEQKALLSVIASDLDALNVYLEIRRWGYFLDAMSGTRLQDEYNQAIRRCDIFVSLFATKTGKYTEEEFDVAWKTFRDTGRPFIYTYFRKATVSTSSANRDELGELGHFYTPYESIGELQRYFRDQLDKLRADGRL